MIVVVGVESFQSGLKLFDSQFDGDDVDQTDTHQVTLRILGLQQQCIHSINGSKMEFRSKKVI